MKFRGLGVILLSLVCGYFGAWLERKAHSRDSSVSSVIRSQRFELVGPIGQTIGVWNLDEHGNTILTFLDGRSHAAASIGLRNMGPNSYSSPIMEFVASDGKPRIVIELQQPREQPTIGLGDERWEGRMMLGFIASDYVSPEDSDWGLQFRHPNLASMGVFRDAKNGMFRGSLFIADGRGHAFLYPRDR